MLLTGISFKSLCQNLADTECALRTNGMKVNTAAKGGRADQLAHMEKSFPSEWPGYRAALLDRLAVPFDSKTALNAIPKGKGGKGI
ncbi:MAG: hypothetical protein JWM44_2065 [Bacilli bacterium]|nr:hypothetical protein [Bacilli bacterium]